MAMPQDLLEADFVVVGAGSAGCVMATRLSEDPATRVVLLEAGREDRNRWIHIPLGYGKTFADASVNWCYEAEPDAGANGRRIFWPRGKVLGRLGPASPAWFDPGYIEDDLWRQPATQAVNGPMRVLLKRAEQRRRAAPTNSHSIYAARRGPT